MAATARGGLYPSRCGPLPSRPCAPGSGVLPASRLELRPRVLERQGAVEDEVAGPGVGVGREVAQALELHGLADGRLCEARLDQAAGEHGLRPGIEVRAEVAVRSGICLLY